MRSYDDQPAEPTPRPGSTDTSLTPAGLHITESWAEYVLWRAAHNTYVATWATMVYVAFVVDVYSRAIVGWAAATHKRAKLVLDALQMALWRRDRDGQPAGPGLVHHSDAGSQYTAIAFTAHLAAEGIVPSIGSVGDALDNALMESAIGLYKTELITRRGPWRDLAHVEMETAGYLHWFNHRRIHSAIGDVAPAEAEAAWYAARGGEGQDQ
jgi:putative transposase